MAQPVTIGIDLGTSKCLAGLSITTFSNRRSQPTEEVHWITMPKELRAVEDATEGSPEAGILPSVFCVVDRKSEGRRSYVGRAAILQENRGEMAIRNVKRLMGKCGNEKFLTTGKKKFFPYEVSAEFLKVIREQATEQLRAVLDGKGAATWEMDEHGVDEVVITVPAQFSRQEESDTKKAARLAGFKKFSLLVEPIAAAYGLGLHRLPPSTRIMMIDVGGGTSDICVLETHDEGFRELGRIGDNQHGGIDWDVSIAQKTLFEAYQNKQLSDSEHLARDATLASLNSVHSIDSSAFNQEGPLLESSELAKRRFIQTREQQTIRNKKGKQKIEATIGVDWFEKTSRRLADWIVTLADMLVKQINTVGELEKDRGVLLDWQKIDRVYLVGGGSRIPSLKECLQQRVQGISSKLKEYSDNPQILVARGAAIFAELKALGEPASVIAGQRLPYDIGILCADGMHPILPANSVANRNGKLPMQLTSRRQKQVRIELAERRHSINYPEGRIESREGEKFDFLVDSWNKKLQGWAALKGWFGLFPRSYEVSLFLCPKMGLRLDVVYGGQRVESQSLSEAWRSEQIISQTSQQ